MEGEKLDMTELEGDFSSSMLLHREPTAESRLSLLRLAFERLPELPLLVRCGCMGIGMANSGPLGEDDPLKE